MGLFDKFKKPSKPAALSVEAPAGTVLAPVAGNVIALGDVPDPVFSSGVMGKGCGIDPSGEVVYAPVSGEVVEANDALSTAPETVNSAAEADGWFADSAEAEFARRHYRHLRRCEQLLRIGDERSNSSLPADAEELLSLATRLGFEEPDTFLRHHGEARVRCREIFDRAMSAAAERAAGEAVAPQGD